VRRRLRSANPRPVHIARFASDGLHVAIPDGWNRLGCGVLSAKKGKSWTPIQNPQVPCCPAGPTRILPSAVRFHGQTDGGAAESPTP